MAIALLGGVALPAVQLAMIANVTPQTASSHLARLVDGRSRYRRFGLVPLLAGLIVAYWLPFSRIAGPPALVGALVAAVFAVPVVFAGLLFSLGIPGRSGPWRNAGRQCAGRAVAGGLLENFSLLLGMRALLPITIGIYCIAAVALWLRHNSERGTTAAFKASIGLG